MAKSKTGEITKEKILQAAREEFIENGFEKANMSIIAKRAGVTKMMLYYHFDSKEKMIRELVNQILVNAKLKIAEALIPDKPQGIPVDTIFKKIDELIIPNKDLIRLVLIEALKGNLNLVEIFTLFKDFYEFLYALHGKEFSQAPDRDEFAVKVFFFQSVPLIFLALLEKDLIAAGIPKKKIKNAFTEKFQSTMNQTLGLNP